MEKVFSLDKLSDEYVLDFQLFDSNTYSPVLQRKKMPAKQAIKQLLDYLNSK